MKKLLFTLIISVLSFSAIDAQTVVGGFRRAGTNAQTKAMQKKQIKEKLNVTDQQAKNIDAIQQNYMLKMRAIKIDTQLSDEEKKVRLKELQAQRKAELKQVISDSQIAKLDGVQDNKKKSKQIKKQYTKKSS